MIIKLVLPFKAKFSISFPFGFMPKDENIRKKYRELGLLGHNGIDFALPEGTQVLAAYSGKVIQSGIQTDLGIAVTIEHRWGQSLYAHLFNVKVSVGQKVKRGELIGLSGKTGFVKGAHLHFGIKPKNPNDKNGYLGFIDPSKYFPKEKT